MCERITPLQMIRPDVVVNPKIVGIGQAVEGAVKLLCSSN